MRDMGWVCIVAMAAALLAGPTGAGKAAKTPQVGDRAPDFRLKATDGKVYTLRQFRGKSAVVLSWYPRVNSPG